MGRLFDLDTPFFRPLWRRAATLGVCLGWGAVEFFNGAPFWGVLFTGMGVIAAWQFATIDWSKYDQPDEPE